MTDPTLPPLEFPCIEVTQPIGTFYIGSLDNEIIQRIAWSDVRRIEGEFREIEIISGLQRKISPSRVRKIEKFVNTIDATFPTSIILAIREADADFDSDRKVMRVRNDVDVAKIIDGQHRIKGLQGFSSRTFQLNVAIFIDMEAQDQAIVFSTINLEQTKVSKSLVYDLYDLIEVRSPQKTCHNIARVAHYSKESPFLGRIKILGEAKNKETELLTQAGFVEPLLRMLSEDPLRDSDDLKRRKRLELMSNGQMSVKRIVFRNMFIANRDAEIGATLFHYFLAVRNKWPVAWNATEKGNLLNKTNGYRAFMNILPFICIEKGLDQEIQTVRFREALERTSLTDADFHISNFPPGTSGERALTNRLMNNLGYGSRI